MNNIYWLKRFIYAIKNGFLFKELSSHCRHKKKTLLPKILPIVTIEELTDESEPLLSNEAYKNGNISDFELKCICKLVKWYKPDSIFEIGTFDGRTTLNMAMNNPSAKIITLDLPRQEIYKTKLRIKKGDRRFIDKDISGSRFIGTFYESNITQIYGDSASFDYKPYENKIDFVFIDGSHSYEYVVNDTLLALKLLRNGKGVIVWHDYGWHEVIKALNEFYITNPTFRNMKNIKNTELAVLHLI